MTKKPESIVCPECGRASWNSNDIREGFCGNCHDWTTATPDSTPYMQWAGLDGRRELGMFWDRDGAPIGMEQWAILRGDLEYSTIGRWKGTGDKEKWLLSTVWMGIDHSFGGDLPIIFETMLFTGPSDEDESHPWNTACAHYATLEGAREGHSRAAYNLELGQTPWFISE